MTKIVAVGDIHHGPNLEQIEAAIEREQPDRTVFVGDYFDQFYDQPEHAYVTAKWLKASLEKPHRIHLWGNHDLPYAFPEHCRCPGFTTEKQQAIRSVIGPEDWIKFEMWYLEGPWLFTHAGLSQAHAPASLIDLRSFMRNETTAAWRALFSREPHWIWGIGRARGGDAPCGGLLWCDWAHEFTPVPGLNQVLGHTPGKILRMKRGSKSENWCIDLTNPAGITHVLAIEDDTVRPVEV
jgi:hypothetical protein